MYALYDVQSGSPIKFIVCVYPICIFSFVTHLDLNKCYMCVIVTVNSRHLS